MENDIENKGKHHPVANHYKTDKTLVWGINCLEYRCPGRLKWEGAEKELIQMIQKCPVCKSPHYLSTRTNRVMLTGFPEGEELPNCKIDFGD